MKPRFEVGYKERLEQSRKAKNIHRLPRLGYAPYRVYEIKKKKEVSVPNFNGVYIRSSTGGKSSYNMTVSKSRQSGTNIYQKLIQNYTDLLNQVSTSQYEIHWLKPKQATLLRLQGYTVEKTTADDESTVGPVRLGA